MTAPRVAFAGMTHLGLCSAAASAGMGFQTLGFDLDKDLARRLVEGKLPVMEPGLSELLQGARERIAFSADPQDLGGCNLIYVAADVPTDDVGGSDLSMLDALVDCVLASAPAESVITVLSQVPPGYTRARQRPGRSVFYQVETLVLGRAIERARWPERIIVGCPDKRERLPEALSRFLTAFGCPILPMRLESAELAKISINCFLAASVTIANTLSELCGSVGADWSEIAPAVRLDRRIGMHAYLTPGLGLAGGNFERDLSTVMQLSALYGTEASAIRAAMTDSAYRKGWVLRVLHEALLSKTNDVRLAILGLAYKENTSSVKNSPALALISHLPHLLIQVFDPVVPASVVPQTNVIGSRSAFDAVKGVDALTIMTPWPAFRDLVCADIVSEMRGKIVVDPYRVLDGAKARAAGLDYWTLGEG